MYKDIVRWFTDESLVDDNDYLYTAEKFILAVSVFVVFNVVISVILGVH
jgi:hypothetical protein